jgi:hypothetical protein
MSDQSAIEDYFLQIAGNTSKGFAFLSSLISSDPPTYETEWLDFKGDVPLNGEALKGHWSRALSGFANTGGGILVFGIDARKDQTTNIDAAHKLALVTNPEALRSRLMELHHQATEPPILGVEAVCVPGPGGAGFVVCKIPASPFRPHRAEHCKKQYYVRAGDDFFEAGPGLLRTLFYPQYSPSFGVEVVFKYELGPADLAAAHLRQPTTEAFNRLINQGYSQLGFEIRLRNEGTATAKNALLVMWTGQKTSLYPASDWRAVSNLQDGAAWSFVRPLHPGEAVPVCSTALDSRTPNQQSGGNNTWEVIPAFHDIDWRFEVFAENCPPQRSHAVVRQGDIVYGQSSIRVAAVRSSD